MINVLSKETIDKIAAGEVAESPESVLKELLDNAVDAGADTVSVEIKGGGIDLIRVTDNGCGIHKDDIRKAFLRHATSKIKEADDISHVLTMGFRGEALNSIAAVSRTELVTKVADENMGTLYRIEGGEEKLFQEVGVPDGTTLIVRDFLYNVPVRRQFLKSPQTEGARLISMVECMALANPGVSISLKSDGRMILETPGNGRLKDAIYVIFGAELAAELIELSYEKNGVTLSGFIAKPVAARSRRDREVFFVNNRLVKSDVLTKAVEDAYAAYLMQHKFPCVFINILTSPESVDVNVHPKKTEIRFSDASLIYDMLTDAIKEAINSRELIIDAGAKRGSKAPRYGYASTAEVKNDPEYGYASKADVKEQDFVTIDSSQTAPLSSEPFEKAKRSEYIRNISGTETGNYSGAPQTFNFPDIHTDNKISDTYKNPDTYITNKVSEPYKNPYTHAGNELSVDYNNDQNNSRAFLDAANMPYFTIVGQVFNTYWIIEYNDEMYMIDQHAAHEKVNYERYMKKIKNRSVESQMLLPPIVISLSARESILLSQNIMHFEEFGYEIEEAGDRDFIVRAVPSNLPDIGDRRLLEDLIGNIFEEGKSLSSEVLKDRVASISCKKAVKGGQKMSEQEIKGLIAELLTLDNPYACPHGRPTIIKWSRNQIEKLFKRIV